MQGKKITSLITLGLSVIVVSGQIAFAAPGTANMQNCNMAQCRRAGGHMGVVKALNLTEDQKTRLKSIREDVKTKITGIREDKSLSPQDKKSRIMEIRKDAREQMKQVLTPDQQKKLAELRKNAGPGARMRRGWARMAKQLGLTEDQKAQIKSIREDARTQIKAIRENNALSPQERKSQVMVVRKAAREKVKQILTPEQLDKIEQFRAQRKGLLKDRTNQ